ncbi:MAG: enoyl-CoA hydratase/isomerase family protein [Dehalococcoidia bacterium]
MEYQRLRFSIDGRIARITLSSAVTGNRIDARLLRELDDAGEIISTSPDVAVVQLDAEGAHFCLGWEDATRDSLQQGTGAVVDPFAAIADLACPTVAVIQGGALSGGFELALACDIRIAETTARFVLPEVTEGRLPLAGATQRLPRIAGKATVLSMLLLGEELDAERAYRAGIISRLAGAGELEAEAESLVGAIASRGPLALRYAKEATVRGIDMTLDQGLRFETDLSVILQSTADRAEGLRAFFEKRPPQFEGR